jgi:general secretion pathway protein A
VDNERKLMDHKKLLSQWTGKYLILWRVPQEYEKDLSLGDKGPLLPWVERHLALAEGRPVPETGEDAYSEALMIRVKKFQLGAGFISDGIVGPKTIIALSALAGNGDPLLFNSKSKGGE